MVFGGVCEVGKLSYKGMGVWSVCCLGCNCGGRKVMEKEVMKKVFKNKVPKN